MIPLYDRNPSQTTPRVTRMLLLGNALAFVFDKLSGWSAPTYSHAAFGFVPARFAIDPVAESSRIFTSMFLHAGLGHIFWNLLFLHIFGDNVEDRLGRSRYLVLYFLGGIAAALGQFVVQPMSHVPMIGASGAIAAVLGAYLVLYPRAPIVILNPLFLLWFLFGILFALPAWAVVGYWFLGNLIGGLKVVSGQATDTAFFAHLGGFAFGLVAVRLLELTKRTSGPSASGRRAESRPPPARGVFWKASERPFWKDES